MAAGSEEPTLMALNANPPDVSIEEAAHIARELFGLHGGPEPQHGERDRNFRLAPSNGETVILKISNANEDPAVVDLQIKALNHIAEQDPDLPVPRVLTSRDGKGFEWITTSRGERLMVRAMTCLPGQVLWDCVRTPELIYQLGAMTARLDRALSGFFHPAAKQAHAWDIMRAGEIAPYAECISDLSQRTAVARIFGHFVQSVEPALKKLRGQVIHGDMNLGNVLANPGSASAISGLIDFGDMLHGPLIAELAIAAGDVAEDEERPMEAVLALVSGYQSILPLEDAELAVLYDAILIRLAATLAIMAWRRRQGNGSLSDPQNYEGLSWRALQHLIAIGPGEAEARFQATAKPRTPKSTGTTTKERTTTAFDDLLDRRHRLLGKAQALFYSDPLHIVRGDGVWLYDATGRTFLDAYNNVAHVGHCHPHVVEAIARQAATLNTNTRYLHEMILDYAEGLTTLMPEGLSACIFVNSGSEANDVAWQMAKAYRGHDGALIHQHAYHGSTDATIALSPEEFADVPLQPHVRALELPDVYRGRLSADVPDLGLRYAEDADRAIADLAAQGRKPAAAIIDSSISSGGIVEMPAGYLPAVTQKVHAAGGLLIGDEVQYGFGRSGSHFWGFDALGAVPDIVTLGKPMGNGHPIGVVVTRPEILEVFTAEVGYFSTYGGNPVSCAAALAVLEVLHQEGLQDIAHHTGSYLLERLRSLAARHDLIGDVRGRGLLIGVELVRDRKTLEPAEPETLQVLDRMRNQGVLVGRTGVHGNVLKIRPPMTFGREHVDLLVDALDLALSQDPRG